MAEVKGPQRLGKAAVTLGVSKDTIVDFLSEKGIKIEDSPMAKIESDAYELLLQEFASDQAAKEKSQATVAKARESRATITLHDKRKKADNKEEEEKEIDYSKFKRTVEEKPEPKIEKPAKKEVPKSEPIAEKQEPKQEEVQEVIETTKATSEVKVVGKVDLEAIEKPKTKGRKKAAEKEEETPKTTAKGKKKAVETAPEPVVPAAEVVNPTVESPEETPEGEEKEVIRAVAEKLSGFKVMGKIELPVEVEKKKPEPVKQEPKPKRKRVNKVDINRQQEIDRRQQRPAGGQGGQRPEQRKTELSEQDVQNQVKATLARLGNKGKSKASKNRREKRDFVARRNEEEMQRQEAENLVLKRQKTWY